MVMERLLGAWDFPARPSEAQRGKGFSEAQQGNELGFKAGARDKKGYSGSAKGLRARGASQAASGHFEAPKAAGMRPRI